MIPADKQQKVITFINILAPVHNVGVDWENSDLTGLNFAFYCDDEIEFIKFMNKVAKYYDQLGLKATVLE